LKHCDK
jgi:predicted RNase H-like HicB family nuclease